MTPAEREATGQRLLAFLRKTLRLDVGLDEPLLSSGLVDSLGLNYLLVELEEAGIAVEELDVTLENLDSVERILTFAARATPPG